jgi:DNA-binding MarR family transcriptional regulator/predicted RNA-binding Zn-ribbon protein involved in translation (DUF1610 family)
VEDTGDAKGLLKLTVKEKLLLQLGEHSCDPDRGEFPVELTQKGLSEGIGVRRSHVAVSLQGLVEDDLVYVRKARIEGEKRRQNSYALTPSGCEKAKELRTKVLAVEADFEMPEGVRRTTAGEFLKVSRAGLISTTNQLELGSIVRDEITIVTKPQKKLISVYCPTCKREMEVENTYADEEVGFDCPGCGRPYRIAPAERIVARPASNRSPPLLFPVSTLFILIGGYIAFRAGFNSATGGLIVASVVILLILASYLASTMDWRALMGQRAVAGAKVLAVSIIFGVTFVLLWNAAIIEIDFVQELGWFSGLVLVTIVGYVGMAMVSPESKGEYLLAIGLLATLVAASLIYVGGFEGLTVASAPFLGVLGVALIALSTLNVMDRNLMFLAAILSAGILVVTISLLELLPTTDNALSEVALGGFLILGAIMISLRFAQLKAAMALGDLFVSTLPLAGSAAFILFGLFMVGGGSGFTGVIEIVIMLPFMYFGATKVFDSEWMYRLPIVAFLIFLEIVGFAFAFMT